MSHRIVMLVSRFPQLSETFIVSKFLGLLDHGWDVHIVCAKILQERWDDFPALRDDAEARRRVHAVGPTSPKWQVALAAPFEIVAAYAGGARAALRYGGDVRNLYLDSTLIRLRPDLVHFEFGALASGRMHVGERLGAKIVVSFRGYDLQFVGIESPGYYEDVWDGADAVHCLGQGLWQRALERGCPADMEHALIPPALDPSWFKSQCRQHTENAGTPERPLRILSVGRLVWTKGHEWGLRAVAELKSRGVRCKYRICGSGPRQAALSFTTHDLGLEHDVEFVGSVAPASVQDHMLWADVLLHPSLAEGFGNVPLEAQALGLPVIAFDADGLSENVAENETGYLVPLGDVGRAADRLQSLTDPIAREQRGSNGRDRTRTSFSGVSQILAFDKLYGRLLNPETYNTQP